MPTAPRLTPYAQLSLEQAWRPASRRTARSWATGTRSHVPSAALRRSWPSEREAELRAASSARSMRTPPATTLRPRRRRRRRVAAAPRTRPAAPWQRRPGGGRRKRGAATAAWCARATYTPAAASARRLTALLAMAPASSPTPRASDGVLSAGGLPSDAYLPIARAQVYAGTPLTPATAPPADGRGGARAAGALAELAASSLLPYAFLSALPNPTSTAARPSSPRTTCAPPCSVLPPRCLRARHPSYYPCAAHGSPRSN